MKRTLVTGAGRGLGLELARQLLERGERVLAAVRVPERAEMLNALASRHAGKLSIVRLDVADARSIASFREQVGRHVEALDLLINNAGINSTGVQETQRNVRFGQLEPDGILAMVRVNALGPLLVTQALVDLLVKGASPRVICISSWLGSLSAKQRGGNYGYCTSKAALNMVGRTMAFDLAERGIASVLINPGWVQTDMGGPNATLTPAQSVRGILAVIDRIGPADAGRFLDWNGAEQAW